MTAAGRSSHFLHKEQKKLIRIFEKEADDFLAELLSQRLITSEEYEDWRKIKKKQKVRHAIRKILWLGERMCQKFLDSFETLPQSAKTLELRAKYFSPVPDPKQAGSPARNRRSAPEKHKGSPQSPCSPSSTSTTGLFQFQLAH